ncbi:hypothetical protein Tco_0000458 [Tanacetum coccineum]
MLSSEIKKEQRIWAPIIFPDLRTLIKINSRTRKSQKHFLSKLLDRLLFVLKVPHWLADFVNYHAGKFIVNEMSSQQEKQVFSKMSTYFWDEPLLVQILLIIKNDPAVCHGKNSRHSRSCHKDPPGTSVLILTAKRFGAPRAIISESDTFWHDSFAKSKTAFSTSVIKSSSLTSRSEKFSPQVKVPLDRTFTIVSKFFRLAPRVIPELQAKLQRQLNSGNWVKLSDPKQRISWECTPCLILVYHKVVMLARCPGFLKPLVLAVFVLRSQEPQLLQLHFGKSRYPDLID